MPLLKDLRIPGSGRAKAFKRDDDEDDMILDAKARDKREKDFFEAKKKREEMRKLAMERVKKQKAEREAREKAAREQAAKEKKRSVGGSVGSGHRRNAGGGNGNSNSAPKGIGGVAQGLKSAAQRDAEEKAYYENKSTVTPIKSMHRAGKDDAGRYTDTDTGRNESSNEEKNNYVRNTTNTEYPKSIYGISKNTANPVIKKFSEENPYDPMAKYDDLFKDGLPNKVPSSPEEMEENLNYYFGKVLQNKIDEAESSGSMAKKGVFGGGVSARGVAGGSGSIGLYEVHDNKGNKGLLVTTGAGGGAGLSKSIVVDTIFSPEMDSIYDLEGASLTQGGSLNLGLLSAGYDNVKPITENGEELPAVHSVAFGLNLPSPKLGANVPVEYHAEGGKAWLIPLGNSNPDYVVRSNMIEDLEEQLERYNNE